MSKIFSGREEFNGLTGFELDDSFFVRIGFADRATATFGLALDVYGVDVLNSHVENFFDCLRDLNFVGAFVDDEEEFALLHEISRTLVDERADQNVSGLHQIYTSSIFATASLVRKSLSLLRMS